MRSRTRRVSRVACQTTRRSSADGLSAAVVIRGSAPGRVLHASALYTEGVAQLGWEVGLSVCGDWSWCVSGGMGKIDRSVYSWEGNFDRITGCTGLRKNGQDKGRSHGLLGWEERKRGEADERYRRRKMREKKLEREEETSRSRSGQTGLYRSTASETRALPNAIWEREDKGWGVNHSWTRMNTNGNEGRRNGSVRSYGWAWLLGA